MTLKLIGAGFGRTGTTSLKAALEQLGFGPCYHFREMIDHPSHGRVWLEAAQGKNVAWEKVFGAFQSTLDWPAAYFYEALMTAYPDARVILTVRDPDRWYQSVFGNVYEQYQKTPQWLLRLVPPILNMFKFTR